MNMIKLKKTNQYNKHNHKYIRIQDPSGLRCQNRKNDPKRVGHSRVAYATGETGVICYIKSDVYINYFINQTGCFSVVYTVMYILQ